MQSAAILWLDNDPGNIESLVTSLRAKGYATTVCRSVSAAELALEGGRFDLMILDVMIPITDEELSRYPFEATEDTLATGLVFYRRMKAQLETANTAVLVMTVRIDSAIADSFREAGLPSSQFATRYEMRDTRRFLARVAEILERRTAC